MIIMRLRPNFQVLAPIARTVIVGWFLLIVWRWGGLGLAILTLVSLVFADVIWTLVNELEQERLLIARHTVVRPDLEILLGELATKAGLAKPLLSLSDDWGSLIVSSGLRPEGVIALEGGALQALSLDGARGMLAHELGHLAGHHSYWSLLVYGVSLIIERSLQLIGGIAILGSPIALFVVAVMAAFISELIRRAFSRYQEDLADAFAARLVGGSSLARGLSELDDYEQAVVRLTTTMERANPFELSRRLEAAHAGAPATKIDIEGLLLLERSLTALYDRPAPSRQTLDAAAERLAALLPPSLESMPGPLRRFGRRLIVFYRRLLETHRSSAERIARLQKLHE